MVDNRSDYQKWHQQWSQEMLALNQAWGKAKSPQDHQKLLARSTNLQLQLEAQICLQQIQLSHITHNPGVMRDMVLWSNLP